MNREEIILSCQPLVEHLVLKYNNHNLDEDWVQSGMVVVIECVDKCLKENMTDLNQIQARCNVWVRNKLIDMFIKKKRVAVDTDEFEEILGSRDIEEVIFMTKEELTPKQNEVFDLLLSGKSKEEIEEILDISDPMFYQHAQKIKKILNSDV